MASFSVFIVLVKLVGVLVPVRSVPRPNLAEPPDQSMEASPASPLGFQYFAIAQSNLGSAIRALSLLVPGSPNNTRRTQLSTRLRIVCLDC
jgi:hypothetical protein